MPVNESPEERVTRLNNELAAYKDKGELTEVEQIRVDQIEAALKPADENTTVQQRAELSAADAEKRLRALRGDAVETEHRINGVLRDFVADVEGTLDRLWPGRDRNK